MWRPLCRYGVVIRRFGLFAMLAVCDFDSMRRLVGRIKVSPDVADDGGCEALVTITANGVVSPRQHCSRTLLPEGREVPFDWQSSRHARDCVSPGLLTSSPLLARPLYQASCRAIRDHNHLAHSRTPPPTRTHRAARPDTLQRSPNSRSNRRHGLHALLDRLLRLCSRHLYVPLSFATHQPHPPAQ